MIEIQSEFLITTSWNTSTKKYCEKSLELYPEVSKSFPWSTYSYLTKWYKNKKNYSKAIAYLDRHIQEMSKYEIMDPSHELKRILSC